MSEILGTERLLGEVMEMIPLELQAAEEGSTGLVPVIVGDPGIGKSESFKAVAEAQGFDYLIQSLGSKPLEGFSGIPDRSSMSVPEEHAIDGQTEWRTTEWSMSDLVMIINQKTIEALDNGKRGLMVLLDDLHLVEPAIQKYLFEFLQNKTLQDYKLHPKAHLVGAMNGKDSAGLEGFLSAVLNRMAIYNVKFDMDYWYQNVGYTLHPYIASFSQQASNQQFFTGANATDGPSPSPRSWTDLSAFIPYLEQHVDYDINQLNHRLEIATESRVGLDARVEFMKHVRLFQKFDFRSIFEAKQPNLVIGEDINDQILMAFIVRYMQTEEDAEYLVKEVINKNVDRRTFISVFIQEFRTMHSNIRKFTDQKSKRAFEKLSSLLVDPNEVDSELSVAIVDGMLDMS